MEEKINVKNLKETVVTFNNGDRKISIYCTFPEDGSIDIKMGVDPDMKDGEEPDSTVLLASLFLSALKGDEQSEIYDGKD